MVLMFGSFPISRRAALASLLLLSAAVTGCEKPRPGLVVARSVFKEGPSPATMLILRPGKNGWTRHEVSVPASRVELQPGSGLDGAPYVRRLGPDGKAASGPLRFVPPGASYTVEEAAGVSEADVEWKDRDGEPERKLFEMSGGNVFHKCMWFDPVHGEPGILTASANMPYLHIWREPGGFGTGWKPEVLWTGVVGIHEHRFRDVEAGDVDGDGQDELVVVTHDGGAVYVLEQEPNGFVPTEVKRTKDRVFVHEVEIGDVDGDGKMEFFTTPSEPNRLDGTVQGGGIDQYRWDALGKTYVRTPVAHFPDRHAKEILVTDYDHDGRAELYAALEAEGLTGPEDRLLIRSWVFQGGTPAEAGDIQLEGKMCRFLNVGDTDGDGLKEIIASTRQDGIFAAEREGGTWKAAVIVPGYASGGFEHATVVFDWDGDGKDELFVASDTQKKLRRYFYVPKNGTYQSEDIADFEGEKYFVWNVMPLPTGK